MTSPITQAIKRAHEQGRCAFIPFLTAGFPDSATCLELLYALRDSGADVIEVGLPFSDPLADGPTIQRAARLALDNGTTPPEVFRITAQAASGMDCPLVLMTYLNPILRTGPDEFARQAKDAGIAGVIVPDLPLEEADEWQEAAARHGLDTIFLVAPTTPESRLMRIAARTTGFLYYVSVTGVTGSDVRISGEMLAHLQRAREVSPAPVAVGFGISTPEQAAALADTADGVIVGSALIREIMSRDSRDEQVAAVASLASSLSAALARSGSA